MRIHYIVDFLALAGTEKQFLSLAGALSQAGHDVEYSVLWQHAHDTGERVRLARSQGVMLHEPLGGLAAGYRLPGLARVVAERFGKRPPDVVHTAMSSSEVVGAVASRRGSAYPWVISRRYMASSKKRSRLRALLQRHLAGRANAIIANSHAALLDAVAVDGIDLQRGHVIPNLITDSAFARVDPVPLERVGPVLVTVANLRPEKGQGDALAAARMMKASGLEFQWILVGGGDYAASLQRQAAEYGLPIILAGSVADPRPYLAAADIYVHPSWSEGMSNAVLEAMAAGLPVVATDVGGTAEALAGAGVLVHPRDPASLANSLIRLWGRSADRESMSSASRQRAQDFRVESCVAAHLDVYREAIGRFEGLSASPGPMLRK